MLSAAVLSPTPVPDLAADIWDPCIPRFHPEQYWDSPVIPLTCDVASESAPVPDENEHQE